jgi:hypothetical protein
VCIFIDGNQVFGQRISIHNNPSRESTVSEHEQEGCGVHTVRNSSFWCVSANEKYNVVSLTIIKLKWCVGDPMRFKWGGCTAASKGTRLRAEGHHFEVIFCHVCRGGLFKTHATRHPLSSTCRPEEPSSVNALRLRTMNPNPPPWRSRKAKSFLSNQKIPSQPTKYYPTPSASRLGRQIRFA